MAFVLHQLLTEAADTDPDHEAVRFGGRSLSFSELERRANSLARVLVQEGVRPGDRVALYVNKGFEQITALHAILKAKRLEASAAPKSTFRHSAREMLALSAWRNNDMTAARKWLDAIAEDGETPPGLRSRAEALQALLPPVAKS